MTSKKRLFIFLFLLLVILACGGGFLSAGRLLLVDDPAQPADAIVSLGGDTNGFPRVRHAVELYHQGVAPVVVLSGGIRPA
jgi:uncharacterized SAM-binding protein YcdF (DUF218 family)